MTPAATYRLQMHAGFTLRDATAILDYLHALGVSHVYTSPLFAAKPGSPHGYDVTDHGRLNPEIGTPDDLAAFAAALRERGMGLLLDVVPNHMSVGGPNAWWHDVLEHGRASRYADHFDIAWDVLQREQLRGKVLLPILGERFGAAVDGGTFRLEYACGQFALKVYDTRLPLDVGTLLPVLGPLVGPELQSDDPNELELRSILTAVRNLPPRDEPGRSQERWVESVAIKRRLAALADADPPTADALAARTAAVNASADELGALIDAQAYRPCYWRVASDEINYRRFFDVNDLAALATEREEVFADVHRLVFAWLADGTVSGLRIDHVDGLYDPKTYLDRLQAGVPEDARPLYVVVEKILGPNEALPADWNVAGTSGYDFLAAVNGLFVDPAGEQTLTAAYVAFGGEAEPFAEVAYRAKFQVLQASLTSELHVLAGHLDRVAQAGRFSRDFTLNGLRHALREVLACFPVYRSYVTDSVSSADKRVVIRAIRDASRRNPTYGREVFDFIRDSLLLVDPPDGPPSDEYRQLQRRFAGKFQQLSAPVMAKGVEDTAFYRDTRLACLNEVGGHPAHFGTPPAALHEFLAKRKPGELNPLNTHDTKRSEDVRARLAVLSELAGEFTALVPRWAAINAKQKESVDDVPAPDGNEEWLLYQTLVGAWPVAPDADFTRRILDYLTKALHEAKVNSSWLNPNDAYDAAVGRFAERVIADEEFRAAFEPFQQKVAAFGRLNTLAQTLLRCLAPGVPDTYQGTELPDFSLVDPDNRRPVDYARRRQVLADLDAGEVSGAADERAKLFVVSRALRLRRERPDVFAGGYVPVAASGEKAECVFAFLRTAGTEAVLVAVPRLVTRLADGWADTRLELPAEWAGRAGRCAFTGSAVTPDTAADLFARFPVACVVFG